MKARHWIVFLVVALGIAGLAAAPSGTKEHRAENVAREKSYLLRPPPNYAHCTDPGDRVQLTDGARTKGYFWTQQGTVGWQNARFIVITVDLGAVEPISGASFNSAAGTAGVSFPAAIVILVSDDGRTYRRAGDLVELGGKHSVPPVDYGIHAFRTDELATRARFLQFVVLPTGPYTFVDEIEVFRGPASLLKVDPAGEKVESADQVAAEMRRVPAVRRRLHDDLEAVRAELGASPLRDEARRSLDAQLAALGREIDALAAPGASVTSTVLPLNDLHRRIFAVQGAVWRGDGRGGLAVWQTNQWDPLSPTAPPRQGGARIDMAMMLNEFRSAAFNISNTAAEDVDVRLAINGLPGGDNPVYLTVHEVPFTDTQSGVPVAAALTYARRDAGRYVIHIGAGMTRQVWLTFNPKDVPAGDHEGTITLEPGNARIPVRLKIYPLRFPDRPALHLGGWDYTDADRLYDVTPENRAALIRHLRERFVDTAWATSAVMPHGRYDRDGRMIEPPDDSRFRAWIERWPDARNYYVFAAVGERFAGLQLGTPAWAKAVGAWITWWTDRLREWRIGLRQLGLLLVDEPHAPEQDRVIIAYAKAIRAAQPEAVIWEDPTWREPWKATPQLFEVCDVLCPNLVHWIDGGERFAGFYRKQRDAGRRLWLYACSGPGRLLDPYGYHRMQAWFCWAAGAEGMGFWAFGDSNGASSWNEYLAIRGAYTPLFLDATSVTPGKHMEAVREGVEDYEYLHLLQERLAGIPRSDDEDPHIQAARALLASAAERVVAPITTSRLIRWHEAKDRSTADRVRVEILEALSRLPDRGRQGARVAGLDRPSLAGSPKQMAVTVPDESAPVAAEHRDPRVRDGL